MAFHENPSDESRSLPRKREEGGHDEFNSRVSQLLANTPKKLKGKR